MKQGYYIGIDVGGTKVLGCLVRFRGDAATIVHQDLFFVHGLSKKEFIISLHNMVKELVSFAPKGRVAGIGVGLPGQIDFRKNVLLRAPNLGILNGLDIRKNLSRRFRMPVYLENDSRCFALAESLFGGGRGKKQVLGIIIGTGIGGGLVIDGHIYRGGHGSAGEVGWMIIDGVLNFGALVAGSGRQWQGKDDPKTTAERAHKGNKKAKNKYREAGRIVGVGISNLINIFDPDIVVLGGGISHAFDLMDADIKKQIISLVASPLAKKTPVVQSVLGKEAGAIGAAALFL
jgi:glucokinase